jgi:2,3-bisphosphoglycerate-dependent phosphoglycerate mutase
VEETAPTNRVPVPVLPGLGGFLLHQLVDSNQSSPNNIMGGGYHQHHHHHSPWKPRVAMSPQAVAGTGRRHHPALPTLLILSLYFSHRNPAVHALTLSPISSSTSILPQQNYDEQWVHTLLLCRHGDSIWNGGEPGTRETFTGWTNVPLSRKGIQEAKATGKQVADYFEKQQQNGGGTLDVCCTSILQRAQLTAHYCLWGGGSSSSSTFFPQVYIQDYRLNERHYGALQGFVKEDVEKGLYGHDPQLVRKWRKSWSTVPPLLSDQHNDPRRILELQHFAAHCGGPEFVPRGESLEQVANQRIKPFLKQRLCPLLQSAAARRRNTMTATTSTTTSTSSATNKNDMSDTPVFSPGGTGLVVAHANSLRALIGVICNVQDDPTALKKLEGLRLQTGVPLLLRFRVFSSSTISSNSSNSSNHDYEFQYQPCDLDGIPFVSAGVGGSSSSKMPSRGRLLVPELPLYPLSSLSVTASTKAFYSSSSSSSNGSSTLRTSE